jgi:PiT family inorganic phosphate transporter
VDAALGLPVLVGLIAVALLFDFLNGLHDAANSIATIVSTRVLRPQFAVFWAAFFNFVAFLVFGLHVAQTIGTGIIDPAIVDAQVIFAALVGAIVWNIVTWALGIPSSSSHALIGGLFGAGVAKAGLSAAVWSGLSKTVVAIVLSPLVGFLLAMVLVAIVSWASVRSTPFAVDRAFRILQFASASLYSLGHGGNDAQKTMGIIAVLLYSQGQLGGEFFVPFWVVLSCQAAMAMGTLMGGWRIVRTMGLRITKADADAGFLRRNRWRCDPVYRDFPRGSRFDDPHHHRCHCWCRRCPPALGGALERRQLDRLCLGDHDAGLGDRRGPDLVGSQDFRQVTSFSPAMPATISPMLARRNTLAGSLNRMMPSAAVPTAPMPVQTA